MKKFNIPIKSILLIGLIAILVITFVLHFFNIFSLLGINDAIRDGEKFYYASIIFLTAAIAWAAWAQLDRIIEKEESFIAVEKKENKIAKISFLSNLDHRYGSEPIIKARTIIQTLHCKTRNEKPTLRENELQIEVSEQIRKFKNDDQKAEDFILLINFLDFLETISYFKKKKEISDDDFFGLFGKKTLRFYYAVFKSLIDEYRNEPDGNQYYEEFKQLVEHLE